VISGNEWIIVILVVVVIFGASRLPLLGRNLGQGIKEFRRGLGEAKKPLGDDKSAPPGQAPTQPPTQGGKDDGQSGIVADRHD
jgi:sec-independent protein translocase protein TatA